MHIVYLLYLLILFAFKCKLIHVKILGKENEFLLTALNYLTIYIFLKGLKGNIFI